MSEAKSEYRVEPLDRSRFKEAAAVLGRAFVDDPVTCSMLPGMPPAKRVRKLTAMFEEMLPASARRNEPVGICVDGSICGAALLHRPGTFPLPFHEEVGLLLRAVVKAGPRGLGRFIRWSIRIGQHHPKSPHCYLETLGVEPGMQGRGLGSAMLGRIAAVLDEDEEDCVLETANDRNVVLYQRFGFEIVIEERLWGAHVRFMRRRPVSAKRKDG